MSNSCVICSNNSTANDCSVCSNGYCEGCSPRCMQRGVCVASPLLDGFQPFRYRATSDFREAYPFKETAMSPCNMTDHLQWTKTVTCEPHFRVDLLIECYSVSKLRNELLWGPVHSTDYKIPSSSITDMYAHCEVLVKGVGDFELKVCITMKEVQVHIWDTASDVSVYVGMLRDITNRSDTPERLTKLVQCLDPKLREPFTHPFFLLIVRYYLDEVERYNTALYACEC